MFSPYSVSDIKIWCERHRVRPSKDRGQNFLIDQRVVESMVRSAAITSDETVIEVGPGRGALTWGLSAAAKEVIAVEIEKKLAAFLRQEAKERNITNVEIREGDFLKEAVTFKNKITDSVIVTSLPYGISGQFFRALLARGHMPRRMVVLLQKEVGERLVARPPHMSVLSILAQWFGTPRVLTKVSPQSFWPQPEVESVVVAIERKDNQEEESVEKSILEMVTRAFRNPRKKIANSLKIPNIKEKNIENMQRRPEELTIHDWMEIGEKLEII